MLTDLVICSGFITHSLRVPHFLWGCISCGAWIQPNHSSQVQGRKDRWQHKIKVQGVPEYLFKDIILLVNVFRVVLCITVFSQWCTVHFNTIDQFVSSSLVSFVYLRIVWPVLEKHFQRPTQWCKKDLKHWCPEALVTWLTCRVTAFWEPFAMALQCCIVHFSSTDQLTRTGQFVHF